MQSNIPNIHKVGQKRGEVWVDLYLSLLSLSWPKLLLFFVCTFVSINALFAVLYMFSPESVAGMAAGSFADAFFFSVHTMGTIGYGTMAPRDGYANTLVTVEAMVGMLGIATSTGLIFAKFSKPTAKVLFSEHTVIGPYFGQRCLAIRVANERGNEVLDASAQLVLIKNELTPEGHTFRRIVDLKLMRDTTPVFFLGWTLFHVIDEHSPLYGWTQETILHESPTLLLTIKGYDASYGQHIFARHRYHKDNIKAGHVFVDATRFIDENNVEINFENFHKIKEAKDVLGILEQSKHPPHINLDDEKARLDKIRRDFVANASHEIRTPLTAIFGFAETLRDGALDQPDIAKKFLGNIMDNAQRLSRLVDELLELSRSESFERVFELRPINPMPLIQKVVSGLEPFAKEKEITIAIDAKPVHMLGNEDALDQILMNLIENAIKYSDKNTHIALKLFRDDRLAVIEIKDEGIGIPAGHTDRIFERFYRVDRGRSRELGGTGLGLSIVKHLVQRMHGEIHVESQVGEGSTFKLTFPMSVT